MAYIIFNNEGNLLRIAADDTDKNNLGYDYTENPAKSVTQDEFNRIKWGTHTCSLNNDNISWVENAQSITEDQINDSGVKGFISIKDATELQAYINLVRDSISHFLKSDPLHGMHTNIRTYDSFLKHFDVNSVTYPINSSWEKYCEDNGITCFHPLQVP